MNRTLAQLGTAGLAVIMAIMMITGGAMAAISFDNETTNTGSTSDLVGGETVYDLDDDTVNKTIEVQSDNATDGDSFTTQVIVNDTNHPNDGRVVYEDSSTTWTATNSSAGHYEATYNHAELFTELQRGINDDVNVDIKVIAEEGTDAEESTSISITASNGDTTAVEVVTEGDLNNSDNVETVSEDGILGTSFGAEDYAHVSGEKNINGSNTDVRVVLAESTVEQKFVDHYDDESVESGETLGKMTLGEDDRLDTFADNAGSDVDSSDSYTVFDRSPEYGENAHLTYSLGEDYDDKKSIEYDAYGIVDMPFKQSFDIFGLDFDFLG